MNTIIACLALWAIVNLLLGLVMIRLMSRIESLEKEMQINTDSMLMIADEVCELLRIRRQEPKEAEEDESKN